MCVGASDGTRIQDFCKAEWNGVQRRNNGSQDCHSLNPTPSPPELRDLGFPGAPGVFKAISVLSWIPEASP